MNKTIMIVDDEQHFHDTYTARCWREDTEYEDIPVIMASNVSLRPYKSLKEYRSKPCVSSESISNKREVT